MEYLIYGSTSIIILFLSYRISLGKSFFLSALATIIILFLKPQHIAAGMPVFFLYINSIPFIVQAYKVQCTREKEDFRTRFDAIKREHGTLLKKDREEKEDILKKEKKLQHILALYEVSKEMSTYLNFSDIFAVFSAVLKKSFRFRMAKLAVLKEGHTIETLYHIEVAHRTDARAPSDFDRIVAETALSLKKPLQLFQEEHSPLVRKFFILKEFDNIVIMPLFVEEDIKGVIYIENLPRVHIENFLILADQFAIQFQKAMLYRKVQEMSITDSLTGLSTRRYFIERFSEEVRRSMRHKTSLSVLMLDLDYFKEKNDKYGHLVGDVILKEVAAILRSSIREIDIIGRYGGEEFCIVLSGIDRKGALHAAERIRESVEGAIFKAYDEVVSTTISIGISVFPDDGADVAALIEKADRALYKAKETGRNKVC